MPKPPSQKDAQLMENIQTTFARLSSESVSSTILDIPEIALQPVELFHSEQHIQEQRSLPRVGYSDLRKRWLKLKTAARSQVYDLAYGMHRYLADSQALDRDVIAEIVSRTTHVGRQFGRLPDNESKAIVQAVLADPVNCFMFRGTDSTIDFAASLKNRMRPHYDRLTGCAALSQTVELANGTERTLYDVYWQKFIADYCEEYISEEKPYVSPAIVEPFD